MGALLATSLRPALGPTPALLRHQPTGPITAVGVEANTRPLTVHSGAVTYGIATPRTGGASTLAAAYTRAAG